MNNILILSNMFIMHYVHEWINNIKHQIQKPDQKSVYLNKTYFFLFYHRQSLIYLLFILHMNFYFILFIISVLDKDTMACM